MRFTLFLFLSLWFGTLGASCRYGNEHARILQQILRLEFQEAQKEITRGKQQEPANVIWLQLENYIDFLTCVIGEERQYFNSAQRKGSERLKKYSQEPDKGDPWLLHCRAETQLQWAFARLKFSEHLSAAKELSRAYELLGKNLKDHPGFLPSRKSMGLLQCLIGSVPEKYKWIPEWKGMKGSVAEGRKVLEEVLKLATDSTWSWLRDECRFYLAFVSLNLDKNEMFARDLITELKPLAKNSPLNLYAVTSLLTRSGRSEEALSLFQGYQSSSSSFTFHYLGYLQGMCLLYKNDTSCRAYFKGFLENFRGHTFLRAARNKLAWSYLLENRKDLYEQEMQKIPHSGSSVIDEDRQAVYEWESKRIPDPRLLRVRLLYDGGYYDEAYALLVKLTPSDDFSDRLHRIEAVYRLGRICEKRGSFDAAMAAYKMVLQASQYADKEYYAPNAALQLGWMEEEKGNRSEAMKYYKICLQWPGHQYKQSLDQKAQAGINRLK